MTHVRWAAAAALTVFAGLSLSACETHKAGAVDRAAAKASPAAPDITADTKTPTTESAKAPAKPPAKPPTTPSAKPPTPTTPPAEADPAKADPAALAAAAAAAAPKPASKSCQKTVASLMKFYEKAMKEQLASVPADLQAQAKLNMARQLAQLPQRLLIECGNWPVKAQKCIQRAKSMQEMASKCAPLLEQARKEPAAAAGEPAEPAKDPAGDIGGPSCKKVAANAAAIVKTAAGYDDRQTAMVVSSAEAACVQERWSEEVKSCIYRAARKAQLDECLRIARINL